MINLLEIDWKPCPFCLTKRKTNQDDYDKAVKGFIVHRTGNNTSTNYLLTCKCGYSSKMHKELTKLYSWWHTRAGRYCGLDFSEEEIEVGKEHLAIPTGVPDQPNPIDSSVSESTREAPF